LLQPYDMPLEQLQQYMPERSAQSDFNTFWSQTQEELAKVPLQFTKEQVYYPSKKVNVYRVMYKGFEQADIEGWLVIPHGEGPIPGLVLYHGYNWAFEGNLHETVQWALQGYVTFQMIARGQQGKSIDNVISTSAHSNSFLCKGILNPKEYYYRSVYMDAVRAIELLASLDEVNEQCIGLTGTSQGGGIAMAAAALSPIPKAVAADYPFLSHFNRAIDFAPGGPYLQLNEYFRRHTDPEIEITAKKTLSYFDVMNLAAWIQCHTMITIGLLDDVSPPSTVFAAYNHLQCSKEINISRYYGHEMIPNAYKAKLKMLLDRLA
jgi:cephalosporin-C deacetylase